MLLSLCERAMSWLVKLREERGATAVEYALMVALIAAVIIVAVALLGHNASSVFDSVAQTLTTAS